MTRILLDENVPAGLRALLNDHDTKLATEVGLAGVANGALLAAAEEQDLEVLITADRNLRFQQNLAHKAIAIIVLEMNHWRTISQNPSLVIDALRRCARGTIVEVEYKGALARTKKPSARAGPVNLNPPYVPLGFARVVGAAAAGSSGQEWRG